MDLPEGASKGTVTPLVSMFSVEEAQKAVKCVVDTVAEKQQKLNDINRFISDNTNLINVVSRLPDDLTHDVMVPFGKAAFFPGRLLHTNEFMVLLGEGYYAERTAKQTVEILKRRGKALETQIQSIKANIEDLRAEASFFDSTALEAMEGLVEIREDYIEDEFGEKQSKSDEKKVAVDDDEYSRMMARLDELEREELAAEGTHDEYEYEDEGYDGDGHGGSNAAESDQDGQISTIKTDTRIDESNLQQRRKAEQLIEAVDLLSHGYQSQLHITEESNVSRNSMFRQVKEKIRALSLSRNEIPMQKTKSKIDGLRAFTGSILENSHNPRIPREQTASLQNSRLSTLGFDSSKAFSGSIVERAHNLQPPSQGQNATSSQPSKPVSRFKMQRR